MVQPKILLDALIKHKNILVATRDSAEVLYNRRRRSIIRIERYLNHREQIGFPNPAHRLAVEKIKLKCEQENRDMLYWYDKVDVVSKSICKMRAVVRGKTKQCPRKIMVDFLMYGVVNG